MKKAGLDKDTGKLMFFPIDTTTYPKFEISNVLVTEQQEIDYLKQQIAGKKFKIENNAIVEIVKTQAEIDAYNLAQAKQNLSSAITQARKSKQVEPVEYNTNQFPAVDTAKTHMNGEINLALYAFCDQKFGAEFTNFMKSRAATWTTVDGKNVNTNIDDLRTIGEKLRIKTRPLYTEEATTLNTIKNTTTQAQLNAITIPPIFGTYTVTPPTTIDGSESLFGGDSPLANGGA